MTSPIRVTIERAPKKAFATAADWPGWSRSGKTEELALEALVAYAPRYAVIAGAAGLPFVRHPTRDELQIVARADGSAGTEFGVPSHPSTEDRRPTDAAQAARLAGLVEGA